MGEQKMKLAILMSPKTDFPEAQISAACRLAKALDLPLTGIATSEDTMEYYTTGMGVYAAAINQSVEMAEKELERVADQFRSICAAEGVAQEYYGQHGFMRFVWPELSPYFDFAVTTAPLSAPEIATIGVSGTIQLGADTDIDGLDGRCLIAWDGSLEAARAVRAAMPLLPRFDQIDVIMVDPKSRTMPHDIGSYLAAHDITVNILREPSSGTPAASVILEEAATASLLVMGAYGVSATLERLFGGVTERIHRDCKTPILFAN
jgi:nucleotide-binding universal stress UspA family protein